VEKSHLVSFTEERVSPAPSNEEASNLRKELSNLAAMGSEACKLDTGAVELYPVD